MNATGKGAVYALGNFDGVHRGHQALLAQARGLAHGAPLVALTFEPHPRRFFAPTLPPFRLTLPAQKRDYLRAAGCDDVRVLDFNAQLAAMSAEDFARRILAGECNAGAVVAGEDFRFGHGRAGDMARLAEWLRDSGIAVHPVPQVRDPQGQRYAASTVRALLRNGQVRAAADILGRPYIISGTVAHGDRRGNQLGFPTANIDLDDYQRPQYGVYAVQARAAGDSAWRPGIANIGRRPTVDGVREWLEAHFFDFTADIYGTQWETALLDFIRPEMKFDGVENLKRQIAEDIRVVRKIFA
ncbi:MAG: riboflavin biosynthesis protein RibF [Alphaproteobacteria bacterium]